MRPVVLALLLALCGCSGGDDAVERTAAGPAEAEGLPDGTHFGFVTSLDPAQLRLVFDVAELLQGAEATAAAEADGGVVTEGGSYVRNPEEGVNRIPLDDHLVVRLLRPCCELHEVSFPDWLAGFVPDDRTFYGTSASHYRIRIEDGAVVAVDEQHIR